MKQLSALFVLIVLLVLVTTAFAPQMKHAESFITDDPRKEYPCLSPKFEVNRDWMIRPQEQTSARWAVGCDPEPFTIQSNEPMQSCPIGSVPLFNTPTVITEGMTLSNGAIVMNVKGNWIVSEHEGTLLAGGGRSMTIVFPDDTFIHGLIVFDNDPKLGESGWTIDNKSIPATGKASWGAMYLLGTSEKQLDFDNGDDSPHFNVCL